jgi:hypothetical protein
MRTASAKNRKIKMPYQSARLTGPFYLVHACGSLFIFQGLTGMLGASLSFHGVICWTVSMWSHKGNLVSHFSFA